MRSLHNFMDTPVCTPLGEEMGRLGNMIVLPEWHYFWKSAFSRLSAPLWMEVLPNRDRRSPRSGKNQQKFVLNLPQYYGTSPLKWRYGSVARSPRLRPHKRSTHSVVGQWSEEATALPDCAACRDRNTRLTVNVRILAWSRDHPAQPR